MAALVLVELTLAFIVLCADSLPDGPPRRPFERAAGRPVRQGIGAQHNECQGQLYENQGSHDDAPTEGSEPLRANGLYPSCFRRPGAFSCEYVSWVTAPSGGS